jgi:outer membrane protein
MKSRIEAARAAVGGARPLLLAVFLGACAGLFARPASAEEFPSRNLQEVLRSTVERHEALGIAAEDVKQATSQKKRFLMSLTPDISLQAYGRRVGTPAGSGGDEDTAGPTFFPEGTWYGYNVSLSQALFTGGRAIAAYRGAGDQESSLVIQEELVRRDLLVAATEAYYGVLAAMEAVRVGEQAVVRAQRQLDLAVKRLELGEGLVTDKLRSEVNLAQVTGDLTRFRNLLADARDSVRRISGRPLADVPANVDRLGEITGGVDALVAEALEARLEREQDRLGIQIAEEDVKEKKGRFLPTFFLAANYFSSGEEVGRQRDGWDAGLFLQIPIYQRASRYYLLKESESGLRQAELRYQGRAKDIALEVSKLNNALEASSVRLETLRKQVEFARENLRLAEKRFSVGLADSLETVDTQTALLESEVNLTAETLVYEVAKLRLYLALGRDIFPDVTVSSVRKTRSR